MYDLTLAELAEIEKLFCCDGTGRGLRSLELCAALRKAWTKRDRLAAYVRAHRPAHSSRCLIAFCHRPLPVDNACICGAAAELAAWREALGETQEVQP